MESTPPPSRRDPRGVTLATIASEIGDARVIGDAAVRVTDVQQDSRKVSTGALFVARAGDQNIDASKYIDAAVGSGAAAVMCAPTERAISSPRIEVAPERLRAAIGVAASAVYGHPSYVLEVLGVTGTNGKTTVTSLLGGALDRLAGRADCAVIGTIGAKIGEETRPTAHTTPEGDELARLLAWARERGAAHAAIEVSSHALDQGRLAGTRLRAAAFTNLTQDHLDYHLTMERYFEAKKRLFVELHPGVAAIDVDDPWGARLAAEIAVPCLRVGRAPEAEVRVLDATLDAKGIHARIATPDGEVAMESPLLGAHNLRNLSLCLAVLVGIGVPAKLAARALGEAPAPRGRLELVSRPGDDVMVLVDYAHTPDALARALAAVRPFTKGRHDATPRLLCVFGCGGDRDPTKRAPMGRAVVDGADVAVVTSDNSRTEEPTAIVRAILEGTAGAPRLDRTALSHAKTGVFVEVDRARAIADAIAAAAPGDVIVIAGKGHEDYQIVGAEKRPFDDVAEARRALDSRRGT